MQKPNRHLQVIPTGSTRLVRKRDLPEASTVWLGAGFSFLTSAAGVLTACLTLSAEVAVSTRDLLIVTASLLVASVLCFLAHWDVNRGRRIKSFEVEESREEER
jgi:hypothetical protein